MNNFTKEELEQLLNWRNSALYTKKPDKDIIQKNANLGNKIQSMIDNYCEHKFLKAKYICDDCGVSEYQCNKCGYVFYEGM